MRSIAIIGGGAGGSLVAIQLLLRAKSPLRIVLVERSKEVGPGVAYSTPDPRHLLNVPAGRMGLFPDRPDDFVRWLEDRPPHTPVPSQGPGAFVSRRLFGEYVTQTLERARKAAHSGVELEIVEDEAVDIEEAQGASTVFLEKGKPIAVEHVVLALGNLPGEYPIQKPLRFYHGLRYVHVPWKAGSLDSIGPKEDILIVGAGLTAVDIIVHLDGAGHRGKIHALSRRGLRPIAHAPCPPYPEFLAESSLPLTVRDAVRLFRAECARAKSRGIDWRAVLDAARPRLQAVWVRWSWAERARFLRHVRPHWEVHRHRIAPQVAWAIARIESEGRLIYHAGRLHDLRDIPGAAEARFRPRGTTDEVTLSVAKVINCTGPRTDYSKYQHPLLINLLARGLIDHDPLALGVQALPTGEVLRYRGGPVGWLSTLGAPLKGVLWESTAIAELRVQAEGLSARLLRS